MLHGSVRVVVPQYTALIINQSELIKVSDYGARVTYDSPAFLCNAVFGYRLSTATYSIIQSFIPLVIGFRGRLSESPPCSSASPTNLPQLGWPNDLDRATATDRGAFQVVYGP